VDAGAERKDLKENQAITGIDIAEKAINLIVNEE
jgi:hypothetical protein